MQQAGSTCQTLVSRCRAPRLSVHVLIGRIRRNGSWRYGANGCTASLPPVFGASAFTTRKTCPQRCGAVSTTSCVREPHVTCPLLGHRDWPGRRSKGSLAQASTEFFHPSP